VLVGRDEEKELTREKAERVGGNKAATRMGQIRKIGERNTV
jgi:hypothetical protein